MNALATELEAADINNLDDSILAKGLHLANHTMGEHLQDWSRALAFIEKICAANPSHRTDARSSTQLAIAYYMNDRLIPATEAEINALSQADDSTNAYVNLKSQLASALVGTKKVMDATRLIKALNAFASEFADSMSVARSLAVSNNNIANELLHTKDKHGEADALMVECAHRRTILLAEMRDLDQ